MLKDIEVKIIAPAQLPPVLYWLLNHKYHTEQWDFVVMFDAKWQILYVNRTVPENDVKKFVDIASWQTWYIGDMDCPIADDVEYVYKAYGWNVWHILTEAHKDRMKKREAEKAQEKAKKILPVIKAEMNAIVDDEIPDPMDDYLVSCINDAGREADRDRDMHECLVNTGMKYVFYLGYLMGSGKIKEEAEA